MHKRTYQEYFTAKAGLTYFDTRRPNRRYEGYTVYNHDNEHVGYVYMTDDERTSSYGYAELYFLPEYENKYGVWHRFTSRGVKLPWKYVSEYLKENDEFTFYVD